jgi:outer membrane biosynthesis protein TonB
MTVQRAILPALIPPEGAQARAVGVAVLGHILLVLAFSLSWKWFNSPLPPTPEIMPVEFVDIADAPRITEPPKPSIEAAPQESAPPEPAPEPAPEPEPEPDPVPEPEPAPKPVLKAEPAPPKPAVVKPAPPKPAVVKPAPPKPLDTAQLSNLIDKALPKADRKPLDTSALAQSIETAQSRAATIDPRAAATLAQAIRAQVAPCWNPPIGGADVSNMTVVIAAQYAPDGRVIGTPRVIDQTGVTARNGDYARAFAETARRAVLRCSPLKLPADLYPQWKSVEINFDPEQMT